MSHSEENKLHRKTNMAKNLLFPSSYPERVIRRIRRACKIGDKRADNNTLTSSAKRKSVNINLGNDSSTAKPSRCIDNDSACGATSSTVASPVPSPPRRKFRTPQSLQTTLTRCYRLNVEEPFNIHEKGPLLEYGDYMAPWKESDLPKSSGPVEYVPPPHLKRFEDIRRCGEFGDAPILLDDDSIDSAEDNESNTSYDMTDIFRSEKDFHGPWVPSLSLYALPPPKVTLEKEPKKERSLLMSMLKTIKNRNVRETPLQRAIEIKKKLKEESWQAASIRKANQAIDHEDSDQQFSSEVTKEEQDSEPQPKLVSLYVIGEYETLYDLVHDGSKRLSQGKHMSDASLMARNRPSLTYSPLTTTIDMTAINDFLAPHEKKLGKITAVSKKITNENSSCSKSFDAFGYPPRVWTKFRGQSEERHRDSLLCNPKFGSMDEIFDTSRYLIDD